MGLEKLISGGETGVHPKSIKATHEKLRDEELCPVCGTENTEKGHTFNKCKNDDCDTFSYRHPEYEVNLEKIWD